MTEITREEKRKKTKLGIIVIAAMIVFFAAYGYYDLVLKRKINGSTLIDNPTNKAISVAIDGKAYEVKANSYLKIDLEMGNHKIDCKAYNLNNQDLVIEPTEYGVINPTQSKYVIYAIIYTEKDLRDKFKPYDIEGREVYSLLGAPKLTTELFIADLTLGKGNIDDKEPSSESYSRTAQDYAFIYKIFRLNDFFEFYDKANK